MFANLVETKHQATAQQADLDALHLAGKRVGCCDMAWLVDQDVETRLLPYATVPELERYARAHALDGILLWDDEPSLLFRANPYGSLAAWDRALRKSAFFGPPRVSGSWRLYPVQPPPA
jgi:hypothetical protein